MAKYKLKMSKTIKIKFPDGKTSTINKGTTGQSIAESISKSLAKEAIAIEINGKLGVINPMYLNPYDVFHGVYQDIQTALNKGELEKIRQENVDIQDGILNKDQ